MDVQLPDGSIARFPDSMSETEVRTVLMKQFPRQQKAEPAPKPAGRVPGMLEAASNVGLASGLTANFGDEILSGLMTPIEMGIGAYTGADSGKGLGDRVGDAYGRALDKNRAYEKSAREAHPTASTVGDVAGGLALGGSAAARGLTLMKAPAQAATTMAGKAGQVGNMLARAGAEGAAYGGAYGAGSGEDLASRGREAIRGAGYGAAAGFGLAGAAAGGGALVRSGATPITGYLNPERAAQTALVKAMQRSGKTPDQIMAALRDATAEGQGGAYAVADELGNSGQRMLSTITRTPNDARQAVTDFLEARQAGQGERLSNFVDETFGASGTGRQASAQLQDEARAASRPLYEQAYAQGPIHSDRLAQFLDDPIMKQGLAKGVEAQRLQALADGTPFNPSDFAITGFDDAGAPILGDVPNMKTLNAAKMGLDDILESYRDPTTRRLNLDSRGHAIEQVRRSFVQELDTANPAYAQARAAYAGPAAARESIAQGSTAATRGRAADNIAEFQRRNPASQQGWREGYADALNQQVERGAQGVNKARPFTSIKSQAERDAYALPGMGDRFSRQLGREQTMFETRNAALGGSKTADNLADQAEMAFFDPTIIGNLLGGNWMGALKAGGTQAIAALRGMPSPVRRQVATTLLQTDASEAGKALSQAVARGDELTAAQIAHLRAIAQQGGQQTGSQRTGTYQ